MTVTFFWPLFLQVTSDFPQVLNFVLQGLDLREGAGEEAVSLWRAGSAGLAWRGLTATVRVCGCWGWGGPWFHLLKELWVILLSCPAREPAEPMGDFKVSPEACWKG